MLCAGQSRQLQSRRKGKDIKKEHGRKRKRRKESNICTLSFYIGYFENVRKINLLMGDVYLVPAKHGAYLHLVTEPFSRKLLSGTVFRWRSETL